MSVSRCQLVQLLKKLLNSKLTRVDNKLNGHTYTGLSSLGTEDITQTLRHHMYLKTNHYDIINQSKSNFLH